jgi:hypothetical protein
MLIKRHGFSYRDAMELTPRQLAAFLYFGAAIDKTDQAIALSIAALGAQGKGQDINKQIKALTASDRPTAAKPQFPRGARVIRMKKDGNGEGG